MKHVITGFVLIILLPIIFGTSLMSQTRIPKSANVHDVVGKVNPGSGKLPTIRMTESSARDIAPLRSRPGSIAPLKGTPVNPAPRQLMSGSNLNVPSTFPTIQEAITSASNGDTINVFPGTYNQDSAIGFNSSTGGAGSENFNIFVNKSLVIRGVTALGVPVTNVNSLLAFVVAKKDVPAFGADAFFVQADNVTISGLDITGYLDTVYYNNKTVEVAGDNFTLKNCKVHGLDEAAAVYISDWHYNSGTDVSHLQSYRFEGNYIDAGGVDANGIRIANGAGWSGPASGRVITGNTFTNAIDNIAFVGPGAEAWDLYPVGAATITGNSFMNAVRRHIIAWGLYNGNQGYTDLDWTNILTHNTFDKGAIPWASGSNVRSWDNPSYGFYYVRGIYTAIQQYAVNKAQTGDVVQVLAGVYNENITIPIPLTIDGAGQGSTIIYPATSDPGPSSGPSFANSQVVVITASNVTISHLTIDGDNPTLTSGVIVHGADIDARNGIIESDGPWNNTTVHHTTVKNVYLRGIYARSGGSGFNIHDNIVQNVDGSPSSIALFNYGGTGIFSNNTVSQAGDAISANHSRGTQFLNNTITNSLSGVHTDNAGDGGGTADLIQGNSVSNSPVGGYGVWDFVPYIAPTIRENTVTNIDVGLGAFGGAFSPSPTVTTPFIRNVVDGQSRANSIGLYISNTTFGYGVTNVAVSMANGVVNNNTYGIYFESAAGDTLTFSGYPNSMSGNATQVITDSVPALYGGNGAVGALATDLRGYWWGSVTPPSISGPSAASVVYSPWLGIGTDADLVTMGFQAVSPMTWYANGTKTLQSAVDFVAAGDVLKVLPGTYTEQIEIAKALTLRNAGVNPVLQSPMTLTKYFTTSANNFPILYVHDAAPVVIRNFTVDGAGRGNSNYRFMGIGYFNAGGTVDSCLVKDVRETPINGDQHGNAIYAYVNNATPRTLNVTNSVVNGFQKNGITTNGAGMTGNITSNTVTGAGAINFNAQNGIQIGFGATGTVSGNTVTGVSYTPSTDVACALLVYNGTDPVVTTNNTFTNSTVGVYYLNVGGTISGNIISATAAACGTPNFWGIDVDPGLFPHLKPQPFNEPVTAKPSKLKSASSTLSISTVVHHNTLTSDGTAGTGLEMDALGGQTLNVHAYRNTITQWGYGVYFYRDSVISTLSAIVDTNTIAGNVYGAYNQTGQLQNAFLNWWGNASGPRDVKTLPNVPNYHNTGGAGDSVSSYIDYNPWYLDAAKTTPSIFTLTLHATNGSVAKNPDQATYNAGTPVQLTASPSIGYHFTSWSGDTVSSVNPLTIVMNSNKSVTANFAINTFTITPTSGPNGSINPPTPVTVNYGSNQRFIFSPVTGYHLDSLFVDGVRNVDSLAGYTFVNVTATHTIRVKFAVNQYTITASNGTNGTITPAGIQTLNYGTDQRFTFTPSVGYHLDTLLVDGVRNVDSLAGFTFKNVTANHIIRITFAIIKYTIAASSGPNGTIAPAGNVLVNYNTSQRFTYPPVVGYHLDSLFVDGVQNIDSTSGYTFNNVLANHTIRVIFTINQYTITPIAGANGSISPPTPVTVPYGSTTAFTFSPDRGYAVDSIIVDGLLQPHAVVYTFTNVAANHSLRVTFTYAAEYLNSFRSFTYGEMPVNKAVRKRPVSDYFEFKVKNTTGQAVTQINVRFMNLVLTIFSPVNFSRTGFDRFWTFTGMLLPNDSILITGRSIKPAQQKILRLWFDPAVQAPQTNLLPFAEHLEYPMPNLANVQQDAYMRGAFSETHGLVVGIPRPDAPKQFGWVRIQTPANLYSSLIKHGLHIGTPRGFDRFDNTKVFVKEQKTLTPLQQNNRLFADLLTLKFNIAISARGITEPGFGELRYVQSGNPYSLMLIKEIATKADSLMTYFIFKPGVYDTLDRTIQQLNSSFSGAFDTLGWVDSLRIKGVRTLFSVPYLQVSGITPERSTPVAGNGLMMPDKFALMQNYPNPFNPTTAISFTLASPGLVTLQVYNILGQEVQTLLNRENMEQGFQELEFNGNNLGSGVYFYRLTVETTDDAGAVHIYNDVRKMLLLR